MKWQPIQNAPLFPKNERAGDAQPRLSFKNPLRGGGAGVSPALSSFFPKNERAGDAQPRLSFKKGGEEEIVDGMASSDLTLKETFCPRRC